MKGEDYSSRELLCLQSACSATTEAHTKKPPGIDPGGFLYGVTDGARTHDRRNHNPELYQLSYNHHKTVCFLAVLPGAPGRTRTCNRRLRRPLLYPVELQALAGSPSSQLVGVEGFEPPTSCSQSRRATRLRYTPSLKAASVTKLESEARIILGTPMSVNGI